MARAARRGRWKFLHAERRGGNFLRSESRTLFRWRQGVSYGPLSRSSGAGKLHEPRKRRWFLSFLRTGFLGERSFARERDAQCGALPLAKRAGAAASWPAAGYPEHGDEWTDLLPAHDFV